MNMKWLQEFQAAETSFVQNGASDMHMPLFLLDSTEEGENLSVFVICGLLTLIIIHWLGKPGKRGFLEFLCSYWLGN